MLIEKRIWIKNLEHIHALYMLKHRTKTWKHTTQTLLIIYRKGENIHASLANVELLTKRCRNLRYSSTYDESIKAFLSCHAILQLKITPQHV